MAEAAENINDDKELTRSTWRTFLAETSPGLDNKEMTTPAFITVIVPTYNRPELLRRALESISKQRYRHYEVIVINDGGEDVEQIVSGFRRTRYINKPINQGLPAARNSGLSVAKGNWIAYLDDDDWYYEWHLGTLAAEINKARFIYSDADTVWPDGRTKRYMSVDPDPGNILSHNITPVCCVLHDRWLINEAGRLMKCYPIMRIGICGFA